MNKDVTTDLSSIAIVQPPVPGTWRWITDRPFEVLRARLLQFQLPVLKNATLERVRVMPLLFYPGWLYCDWQCDANAQVWASLLYGPDGFTALSGDSGVLATMNQHVLDLSTVEAQRDYLRFYTSSVRGEGGPFDIIEDAENLRLSNDGESKKPLKKLCKPLKQIDAAKELPGAKADILKDLSCWKAAVLYDSDLFLSVFSLQHDGMVAMIEDKNVATNVLRSPRLQFDDCVRSIIGEGHA